MKKNNNHEENNGKRNNRTRYIAEKGIPPVYLREYVTKAYVTKSPATLLSDGKWCGHGGPLWNIFSLTGFPNLVFFIKLSKTDTADIGKRFIIPRVEAAPADHPDNWFTLYDARFHPGSIFAYNRVNPKYVVDMLDPFECVRCKNKKFRLAVGFEIPAQCANPNDLSWFSLAVECDTCGWKSIIYHDEIVKKT